jgi:hypothetical protein
MGRNIDYVELEVLAAVSRGISAPLDISEWRVANRTVEVPQSHIQNVKHVSMNPFCLWQQLFPDLKIIGITLYTGDLRPAVVESAALLDGVRQHSNPSAEVDDTTATGIYCKIKRHVEWCEESARGAIHVVRAFVPVPVDKFLIVFRQPFLL